jgi:hypothetical protein
MTNGSPDGPGVALKVGDTGCAACVGRDVGDGDTDRGGVGRVEDAATAGVVVVVVVPSCWVVRDVDVYVGLGCGE